MGKLDNYSQEEINAAIKRIQKRKVKKSFREYVK